MYNQDNILNPSSSKNWIIVFSILIGLMLATVSINAQSITSKVAFNDNETVDHLIKYFNVKEVNNTLYFNYLVVENRVHTAYTLESSSNGTDFYTVQLKEGFKSPSGVPLLYCYSVDLNVLNDRTYRIRRDSPDGINYSTVINRDVFVNPTLSAQNN